MLTLNEYFSKLFYKIGHSVGRQPKFFIIAFTSLALVLSTGVLNVSYKNDIDYLFSLRNQGAALEKQIVSKYFPLNSSEKFTPSRMITPGRHARIFIKRKDGNSILTSDTWKTIIEVDRIIQHVSIEYEGNSFNYSKLCATWNGDCFENKHLNLGLLLDQFHNGTLRFNYPVMFNPITYETYAFDLGFGGIETANDSISSIKAISLYYFAKIDTKEDEEIGLKWERALTETLTKLDDHWEAVEVYRYTFATLEDEPERNNFSVIPYFAVSCIFMVGFIMWTSSTGDWVTSKPLVACMGIISSNLGAAAGCCVLFILGVDFIGINTAIPFVVLGIGIDDTFVILASWWKTSSSDSVPERMAHCYSDAGVSITITTLTDMLSFYVGILSPIPSVQIFCAYAGTSVLFIYIWHLFFFGGILAWSGYAENENRHSLLIWRKALPKSETENMSAFKKWLLTGGSDSKAEKQIQQENKIMIFFRDSFSPFLERTASKILVLLVLFGYICAALYGVSKLKEGMSVGDLASRDSYMWRYFEVEYEYFRDYFYREQVIITTPLDYSSKENQEKVLKIVGKMSNLTHTTWKYNENWLVQFLQFVDNYGEFYDFNVTTEQDFIDTLRSHFLTDTSVYTEDVKFNENFTKIIATRYIVPQVNLLSTLAEKEMLMSLREVSNEEKEWQVTAFSPYHVFFDIAIIIRYMTITLVSTAAVVVMAVCIIFIPSIPGTLCVLFSIATIELGVLGFLSLLGVGLDLTSVITLIMCIGFSVDFSAHVSYAYISSKYDTVEERVRDALYSLGLPILQGALSTIISITGVIFMNAYVSEVFLKVVYLVMTFATFNALFVLPVLLLIFRPEANPIFSRTRVYTVNK